MRRGFSLIETVIVVAIVGVIAGVAVPRYISSLNNYHAKGAAQAIASLVLEAQSRARATSANVTVQIYGTTKVGQVEASGTTLRQLSVDSDAFRSKISNYTLGGDKLIIFDGFGKPDTSGVIGVASGAAAYKVVVDSQGRVMVMLASAAVPADTVDFEEVSEGPPDTDGGGGIHVDLGGLDIILGGGGGAIVQLN